MRDSDECMASTLQFGHVRDGRQKNLHNLSVRWKAHICLVLTALAVVSLDRRLPNLPQGKWQSRSRLYTGLWMAPFGRECVMGSNHRLLSGFDDLAPRIAGANHVRHAILSGASDVVCCALTANRVKDNH